MTWLQIQFGTDDQTAPRLEQALESAGAVSVTMLDAQDQPLYEPGPGETPLWHQIMVYGLFTGDCQEDAVLMAMAAEWLPEPLPPHRFERIEDQDWERAWMKDFRPMRFGNTLWVCPSGSQVPEPEAVNLFLDPGLAFGSGTHPTTAMCLEWLDANPPLDQKLLDYGCGSGILGIAALLLGADKVTGVDNDPQALAATHDNCQRNQLDTTCFPVFMPNDFLHKSGEKSTVPVDGILANILAGPLVDLSRSLASMIKPGGWLVLSGILQEQAETVIAAYTTWFEMDEPVCQEDWVRLTGVRREELK